MGKNISDLLKLKDTLEIVPEDPYQDVYDEVSEELAFKEFNAPDLFCHCVGTCHKIKRIELWKLNRNYLRKFFGIAYDGKSDSESEKYETLRLLKILYDCINECQVDLAYHSGYRVDFRTIIDLKKYTFTNICQIPARIFLCTAVTTAFARKARKDVP